MSPQSILIASTLALSLSAPANAAPADTAAATLRADLAREGAQHFTSPGYRPGTLRHLVLFRYKDTVTPAQRADLVARLMALGKATRGGHPYFEIERGTQLSGEGLSHGFEEAFLLTFRSEGDRNYYVGAPILDTGKPDNGPYHDKLHDIFKKGAGDLLADVLVFDYRPGTGMMPAP